MVKSLMLNLKFKGVYFRRIDVICHQFILPLIALTLEVMLFNTSKGSFHL